jgi:hypothetical protein
VAVLRSLPLLLTWLVRHACTGVGVRWLVHELLGEPSLVHSVVRRARVLRWLLLDISRLLLVLLFLLLHSLLRLWGHSPPSERRACIDLHASLDSLLGKLLFSFDLRMLFG